MNALGLKTVSAAGTPVQLSASGLKCRTIVVHGLKAIGATTVAPTENVGAVYLMRGNVAKGATGASVAATILPGEKVAIPVADKNSHALLSDFYLDADNNGDGGVISYAM